MINDVLFPKAYKEVLEILKYVPKEDVDKLPKYIIENMKKEQDINHEYHIVNLLNFDKQPMLEETEVILSVFYRDYWATEEERKQILMNERKEKLQHEEEKAKSYVSLNDIFKIEEEQKTEKINNQLEIKREENIFIKILKKIKTFFKKD